VPTRNGSGRRNHGAIRASARRSWMDSRARPPVRGLLVIERRAAAEVVGLDECDTQPAARRVVRAGEPVDTAADDQQIISAALEPGEIARAHVRVFIL
jgi:hypothetical protein